MRRGGCFLIIITVALLWGGGQGLYTAVTNPRPKEYSVEDHLREKPSDKWLRLTGGVMDLTNLNYQSLLGVGHISEIYVPLKSARASSQDQVHILVATKSPALLQMAEQMRQLGSREEALHFVQEHARELVVQKDVTGLVRYGLELEDRDVRKLRKLNDNLAQDFVVVADGERPDYLQAIAFSVGGVALAAWLLKRTLGSTRTPPPPQPPPIPPSVQRPPPLPGVR